MNICAGGMGLVIGRDKHNKIHVGDHLVLTDIEGLIYLSFMGNQDIVGQIKWIQKHRLLESIVFGLEFQNISQPAMERIEQLVSSCFL